VSKLIRQRRAVFDLKKVGDMALPDFDKAVGYSFGLEIDGMQIKQIQEVAGLKTEAGEVTLTRGLTGDNSFETLIKDTRSGQMGDARKDGLITVFHEGDPLRRYKLTNCWPKSLEIAMKAGDTSVLTEKLVVTYESMEPE
jgi:hypothetical protein